MGEKYTRKIQIVIAVLSAVLSIGIVALIGTTILRQLYGDSGPSDTAANYTSTGTPVSDVAITLSGSQAEDSTAFSIRNLLPGQKETKQFNIQVSYRDQLSLCCDTAVRSDNKLADVMCVSIRIPSTNQELYNGSIKEMPCLTYDLRSSSKTTEEICYEVSLYLDPSADNTYQDMEFEADFRWWAEQSENLSSPRRSNIIKVLLCVSLVMTAGLVAIVLIEEYKSKEEKRNA